MTSVIDATQTTLVELLDGLHAGDTVILTAGDKKTPVARVEAIEPAAVHAQRTGFLSVRNIHVPDSFFDPLPASELRLWEEEAR